MQKYIIVLFFILYPIFTLHTYAQSTFKGVVRDEKGKSVPVTITIQEMGSITVVGYSNSNDDGKYSILYKGTNDSLLITVRGLTIEKQVKCIPNKSATIDFVVSEKNYELQEVNVIAHPIQRQGDTLNYIVNSFLGQNDQTIEDVMKKMPGIDISSSGNISFNGKKISKFYIENLDLLGGRYNLATKNIAPSGVASVQVLENHQSMKVESAFSDEVAINLKLKDGAKGVWTITALAGAGYKPTLWNAELTAMYFAKKLQNISVYKGNNTGRMANEELIKHYDLEELLPNSGSMLSVSEPSPPPFSRKRYLNNTSNYTSINHLFKTEKEKELKVNIAFYNEQLRKHGYSSFTEYLPDNNMPLVIEESIKNVSNTNNLDLSFQILSNNEKSYFNNVLNINTVRSNSHTQAISQSNRTIGNDNIFHYLNKPYFALNNTLNSLKRNGNNIFRVRFSFNYNEQPHNLQISPVYYFGEDSLKSLNQELFLKTITTNIQGSYSMKLKNFQLNYSPWVSMELRKLKSELNGENLQSNAILLSDSLRNNLSFNNYRLGINQEYSYNKDNLIRLRLTIPTYFSLISTDNQLSEKTTIYNHWIFNPSLYASYRFSSAFEVSFDGYYHKTYGDLNDVSTGYIMQSYRNLLRNTSSDRLLERRAMEGNIVFKYNDAIRMLFLNLKGRYLKSHRNLLYGYRYDGIVGIKTTIDQPTISHYFDLKVDASKALDFWQAKLQTFVGLGSGNYKRLIQNDIQEYYSKNYFTGISLNITPCKYFDVNYNTTLSRVEYATEEATMQLPAIYSYAQELELWVFPSESLSINFNLDYQYYNELNTRNTVFADALIRYKYKTSEFELECNNLFNAKQFVSTSFSGMSTYINQYQLRPLSFLLRAKFRLK